MRFSDIDRLDDLERLALPALFLHDVRDDEVQFEHALRLSARMRNARVARTHGLGPHRIVRDYAAVGAIANFVAGHGAIPTDLPALPRPAPIY